MNSVRPTTRATSRPGFTITEMLVTVGVIVILASILVISLSSATRSAQRAKTVQLMNSIKTAISRFKVDQGYLPPMLGVAEPTPTHPVTVVICWVSPAHRMSVATQPTLISTSSRVTTH